MTATETPQAAPARPGRGRSIAATIIFILAVVLTPVAIIGHWGHQTVTDSERYIETVGPLAYSEEVQDSIATFVTDKIQEQINPDQLVTDIFGDLLEERPTLKLIVPVIAGAIDSLIREVVDRVVRSEQFEQLWNAANVGAQKAMLAILEGNNDGAVRMDGDEVVLDTNVLIEEVKKGLVDRGFGFAANISIPQSDTKIVLLEAPQVAQLQSIYALASPILAVILYVVAALYVVAILVARRRPRMVAWTGGALVVVNAALLIGLSIGQGAFTNTLAGTPFGPASDVFYTTLLYFLTNSATVGLILGVVLLVTGWFLSQAKAAVEVRAGTRRAMTAIGSVLPEGPIVDVAPAVAKNARWLRIGIAVLFTIIVVAGTNVSVARTIWAIVIAAILLLVVHVISTQADRATPKAVSA